MDNMRRPMHYYQGMNSCNCNNMEKLKEARAYMESMNEMEETKKMNEMGKDDMMCDEMVLAMAYVPMQKWNTVYDVQEALYRGTIFPELDLPFYGSSCGMRGEK